MLIFSFSGQALRKAQILNGAHARSAGTFSSVQVLWEQARDARTLMALEDTMSLEDRRRRQTSFSELLLRHLVTGLFHKHVAHVDPKALSNGYRKTVFHFHTNVEERPQRLGF